MSKKAKIIAIVICILMNCILFAINRSSADEPNITLTTEEKAIKEIANAYYNKGINEQYCLWRKSFVEPPEEATSQHNLYSVCSDYAYSIYYQGFGIKIPYLTHTMIAYAMKYYDKDNIDTNDVIEYWHKTSGVYKDNNGNTLSHISDLSDSNNLNDYCNYLLQKLKIGDVICYRYDSSSNSWGHAVIVYDFVYNNSGQRTDAIIRESNSRDNLSSTNYDKETTKIKDGLNYAKTKNGDFYEGTIREKYLKNQYEIENGTYKISLGQSFSTANYFTILRPLLKDTSGNYTGKYYFARFEDDDTSPNGYKVSGERELKNYQLTDYAQRRINYSGINIEKTVDVFNNSTVSLGDILEYTINISNKGSKNYNSFNVIENINENYLNIVDNGSGTVNSNGSKITWNIQSLNAGQKIQIKYKVKVKENILCLDKDIVSTGTVAGMSSATVKNHVSANLRQEDKTKIKNETKTLIESGIKGVNLINQVYSNSFEVDYNFDELDITDLIKTQSGTAYYPEEDIENARIYINEENSFYDMLLSNYYGALQIGATYGTPYLKYWENADPTNEFGRSKRADNIYSGNFETGDVLVYKNEQTASSSTSYLTESGYYYLIYICQDDQITVNGNNLYGFIGVRQDGSINRIYKDESKDYSIEDLRTLLGKDYFAIFRPSNSKSRDITPMSLNATYSITEQTNRNVDVTITSNEEMLGIEGWTLSNNKKELTKTYSQNTNETIQIYDYAGNLRTQNILISNIDKDAPEATVQYSTTELTNQDVTVTITTNERVQNVEGWTLSDNEKELTRVFNENTSSYVTVTDLVENETNVTINITNIDKDSPNVTVTYSTQTPTNDDVQVTITANEKIQEVQGWNLSTDQKTLTKTYSSNITENITISDLAGNTITKRIVINNIDKTGPTFEIEYSTTSITNQDVTVTITASEEIQEVQGWSLSTDKKVLTKTYTENTEETINITDVAGNNSSRVRININNIDKTKPEITTRYSQTELTNEDVIVTITANEEIQQVEGWTLSQDHKTIQKTFNTNANENVVIYDLAGNSIMYNVVIENIDKTAPNIEINYSEISQTHNQVIVTIVSNEPLQDVDGWEKSQDGTILTKTYSENKEETVIVKDIAGNSTIALINVSNIENAVEPEMPDNPTEPENPDEPTEPEVPDNPTEPEKPDEPTEPEIPDNPTEPEKPDEPTEPEVPDNSTNHVEPEEPTETENSGEKINKDNTTTSGKLPQTGKRSIFSIIIGLTSISVITFIKQRKYSY